MQYLVAPGTADEIIWRVVNRKLQVVGNVLDGHLAGTATGEYPAYKFMLTKLFQFAVFLVTSPPHPDNEHV